MSTFQTILVVILNILLILHLVKDFKSFKPIDNYKALCRKVDRITAEIEFLKKRII